MTAKMLQLCRALLSNSLPKTVFQQLCHRDLRSEEQQKSPLRFFLNHENPQESVWPLEIPEFEIEPIIPFELELRDTQTVMNSFEETLVDQETFFQG
jgi:hypothetical protein